jgi:hypothetical protein
VIGSPRRWITCTCLRSVRGDDRNCFCASLGRLRSVGRKIAVLPVAVTDGVLCGNVCMRGNVWLQQTRRKQGKGAHVKGSMSTKQR